MSEIISNNNSVIVVEDDYKDHNDVFLKLFDIVRIITPGIPEDRIFRGNTNTMKTDLTKDCVLLMGGSPVSEGKKKVFDSKLEQEISISKMRALFTIGFYGTNAMSNAFTFFNNVNSEEVKRLQQKMNISINEPQEIRNTGEILKIQKYERWEVDIRIYFLIKTAVKRQALEDVEINFLKE